MELPVLRQLMATGQTTVVCGSGGGLPVRKDSSGQIHGVEAVIDQDKTAALVAKGIEADALLLLSATEAIVESKETGQPRAIKAVTPEKLGSIRFNSPALEPKICAVRHYIGSHTDSNSNICAIGSLFKATDVLSGKSGTRIANDVQDSITYY